MTQFKNGILDSEAVEKSGTYTVVITTDSGKSFSVKDDTTFTLPGIAIGNVFTFVYAGKDGEATLTISPNASDGITYAGSSTDNKDLILTQATARRGDYVKLASLDGTTAWQVIEARGTWAKEA